MVLEPGMHPDAEQLSAFAEEALPVNERAEVMGPLAGCARCRMVVALALPEEGPAALPVRRRAWWAGWRLAWPVLGLVAMLLLGFVALRRGGTGKPGQVAGVRAPAGAPILQAAPQVDAISTVASSERKRKRVRVVHAPAPPVPKMATHALSAETDDMVVLPLEQRSMQPSAQGEQKLPLGQRALNGRPDGATGAPGSRSEVAAQPKMAAPGTAFAASAPAPAPPLAFEAESIEVVDTALEKMTTLDLTALLPEVPGKLSRLPSRQPIAAVSVYGARVVAIDGAGQLFVSFDRGKKWMTVREPWGGRPVDVRRVSVESIGSRGQGVDELPEFELVTDRGERWRSAEGLVWVRVDR